MSLERIQYEAIRKGFFQLLGCDVYTSSAPNALEEVPEPSDSDKDVCCYVWKAVTYLEQTDLSDRQKRDFLLVAELIASYIHYEIPENVVYHDLLGYFNKGMSLLSQPKKLEKYINEVKNSLKFPPSSCSDISSGPL